MTQDYKNILRNKYLEFSIEENNEHKNLLSTEICNIIKNQNNLDSEDYQIWGLTYYNLDDDLEANLTKAISKFKSSVDLDNSNFLARLYLAHCYHDLKDYENALEQYQLVDSNQLKSFQLWRFVKWIEQIGFCQYILGRKLEGEKKFNEVISWYKKLPEEERVVPSEMLSCLPEDHELVIEIKKLENYLN